MHLLTVAIENHATVRSYNRILMSYDPLQTLVPG